ncbi:hypothetical protein WUBG_18918, partial [Wuchereria bancrofti]
GGQDVVEMLICFTLMRTVCQFVEFMQIIALPKPKCHFGVSFLNQKSNQIYR